MRQMKWGLAVLGLAAATALGAAAIGIAGPAAAQVAPDGETPRGERYRELLASELSITIDELTAAQAAARDALVDELLASDDITQEQADRLKAMEPGQGFGFGIKGRVGAHRFHKAAAGVFESAAEVVGLEVDVLRDRVSGGESLVEIAGTQGIDEAALKSGLVSALTAKINQAVIDGDIDQDQADMRLETLEEKIDTAINAAGPFEGGRGGPRGERFQREGAGPGANQN